MQLISSVGASLKNSMTTSKPNRLPSLNQLASRLGTVSTGASDDGAVSETPNAAAPSKDLKDPALSAQAAPNRPRLAAFALRTTSASSNDRAASSTTSLEVNVSGTRDPSPTPDDNSESKTTSDVPKTDGNLTEAAVSEHTKKVGYKNIPSLDAITARLAKARHLSIDGSAKPPEPEPKMQLVEDPKTPGLMTKIPIPEHPLASKWTIYHDTKMKYPYTPAPGQESSGPAPADTMDYEAGLTVIGTFDTVETYCRYFNWLKPPSQLPKNSNYHLFKAGIKPMWEDPANENGGKWVLTMKSNPQLLDRCWSWLTMALVGQEIEEPGTEEVCGAVVSLRSKVDRIQLWTRSKEDISRLNVIGKKMAQLLDVSEADSVGLEFQYNTDDRPPPNKFIAINAMPTTAVFGRFGANATPISAHPPNNSFASPAEDSQPHSAGPRGTGNRPMSGGVGLGSGGQGAFGSFGIGIGSGAGNPGWRKRG